MPRPGQTITRSTSKNPISNWRKNREQKKKDALESAAKAIVNQTAKNENTMYDRLMAIDFINTPLKDKAEMEKCAMYMANSLKNWPQEINMDIRPLDEKLLALIDLYSDAVEYGREQAAKSAQQALLRGFQDIRSKMPRNQPKLAKQFVEENARYLENWITLVLSADQADQEEANLKHARRDYEVSRQKHEEAAKEITDAIMKEDSEEGEIYRYIQDHDLPEDRLKWNAEQSAAHTKLVEMALSRVVLETRQMLLSMQEDAHRGTLSQISMMYTKLANVTVVTDPNLLNKQKEIIESLFVEFAETDKAIDEAMTAIEDVEGRLAALNTTAGNTKAAEAAKRELDRILGDLKEKQQIKLTSGGNWLHDHDILTEEELEELKKEQEEEHVNYEPVVEENWDEDTDAEANYN